MQGYAVVDKFHHPVYMNPITGKWTLGRFLFDYKEQAKQLRDLMNDAKPGCPHSGIIRPFQITKVK